MQVRFDSCPFHPNAVVLTRTEEHTCGTSIIGTCCVCGTVVSRTMTAVRIEMPNTTYVSPGPQR